jgi:hypothetical protein
MRESRRGDVKKNIQIRENAQAILSVKQEKQWVLQERQSSTGFVF